jgi:hypothetical protein
VRKVLRLLDVFYLRYLPCLVCHRKIPKHYISG